MDQRSVSYVNELAAHVAAVCQRHVVQQVVSFPERIFVTLRPVEFTDFDGPYRIRFVERGGVNLDLKWNAELDLETLTYGLTEAYLLRYAIFRYGHGAETRVRYWVISALAAQSYLSLRPAQYATYLKEGATIEGPESITRLDQRWSERDRLDSRRFGYWILAVLKGSGFDRRMLAGLIEQGIAGEDVTDRLQEQIFNADAAEDSGRLLEWWQSRVRVLSEAQYEASESMEVSRQWLEAFANFQGMGGAIQITNLRDLWKHRADPTLRETLQARNELLRLRMQRVNPAYFNAARSLGALFEVSLDAAHFHDFVGALTVYLSDWEDTKRLESEVRKALNAR